MQHSDVMTTRLLFDQVQDGACIWAGDSERACTALLATMICCTAVDTLLSPMLVLGSTALQRSQSAVLLATFVALHCSCLVAEVGIAAVTILLWIGSNSIDGHAVTMSDYLFFAGSLASTFVSTGVALYSLRRATIRSPSQRQVAPEEALASAVATKLQHAFSTMQARPMY